MPETPRWLLSNGRRNEAIAALTWLRGSPDAMQDELVEMEANLNSQVRTEVLPTSFYRHKLETCLVCNRILYTVIYLPTGNQAKQMLTNRHSQ